MITNSGPLRDLVHWCEADPAVVGLVLTGSQARAGMAGEHSDIDVYVVTAGPTTQWRTTRSAEIDMPVCTIDQLRHVPGPDEDGWWDRYSFTHSQVLMDRAGGEVARLVEAWGALSGPESKALLETHLDGYVNSVYRSLKNHRDDRAFEARMDAVESLPWALTVIFALHRRVRPYNKYLRWELEHFPLEGPEWDTGPLVELLNRIVTDAHPEAQRGLFAKVERASREVGLGGIIDGWGDELALLRPGREVSRPPG